MPVSVPRRVVTTALIVASGVSALLAAGTRPTSTTVHRVGGTGRVQEEVVVHPLGILLLVWLVAVAVLAAWATVAYARGRHVTARRVLLAAGLMGIAPAIVPGLAALAARALTIREQ
ncbi:hypothetical protein [Micromonospora globbae]|uniref:hypothetical protein n=1 Tax=Micromonospora globbae TaxID=1894969 RepID=UPI0034374641